MSRRSPNTIKPTVDPLKIFYTADMYQKTAGRLFLLIQDEFERSKTNGGLADVRYFLPQMMLAAFATELYFKCIHAVEHSGQTIDQHDLQRFYNRLTPATKAIVARNWDQVSAVDPTMRLARGHFPQMQLKFEECLKESRNSFEKLRYHFEAELPPFTISIMPTVLRRTIFELKPDWSRLNSMRKVFAAPPGSTSDEWDPSAF